MSKRIIAFLAFTSIFLSFSIYSYSQSLEYTLEFRDQRDLSVGDVIEVSKDTFLTIVRSVPPQGGPDQNMNYAIWFSKEGIIDSTILMEDSIYLQYCLPVEGKKEYIIAGTQLEDSLEGLILLRVDWQGNPLDTSRVFPFKARNSLNKIRPHNQQYLVCGSSLGVPGFPSFHSFVGAIDSNLKKDTITGYSSNQPISIAFDIAPFGENYIHTGIGYVQGSGVGTQIIATDSLFNIDSIYTLPEQFGGSVSVLNSQYDSTFYVSGRAPSRDPLKGTPDLFIGKWHVRLGLTDTTIFGSYDSSNIEVVSGISQQGSYMYFGGTVNYDVPPEFGYQQSKYLVAKFDTNLNLIWQRSFEVNNSYLYLQRILATSDGGCLLAGNKFDYIENPTKRKRSVYIVKLDSSGNLVSGIDNTPKPPLLLSIYPNPTSDLIRIVSPISEEVMFELFNSTGQLVDRIRFTEETELTVKHLPSGVYLYRFKPEDGIGGFGKVVVQK